MRLNISKSRLLNLNLYYSHRHHPRVIFED